MVDEVTDCLERLENGSGGLRRGIGVCIISFWITFCLFCLDFAIITGGDCFLSLARFVGPGKTLPEGGE